jgi:hypothetical protein
MVSRHIGQQFLFGHPLRLSSDFPDLL